MSKELFLGLDIGTSGVKAVLCRADGEFVAAETADHPFSTPRPSWAEADPEDWWNATVRAVRLVLEKAGASGAQVRGIGVAGQMHGLVALDERGQVIRPCIMWNDQRPAAQAEQIMERVGRDRVLEITGNPVLSGFTSPKVQWVHENEPENFKRIAMVLLPKDYIRYRISGAYAADVSDASGTSWLNVRERKWSDEMIEAVGLSRRQLPPLMESAEKAGELSAEAAKTLGLEPGIPIAAGAGDQAAQALGSGIVQEGIVSATFGTSGVVFAHARQFRYDPAGRLHAFCAAIPGEWHLMGVMLSAAGSLSWYVEQLFAEKFKAGKAAAYQELLDEAATAPIGAEGLTFLPYLSGERSPYPDPNARGVFFGLSLAHRRAHVTRAVVEGITYGMRDSLELMRGLGLQPESILISGGGARNPWWRQMIADVFQTRVRWSTALEGAAMGGALLAVAAAGASKELKALSATACKEAGSLAPDAGNTEAYAEAYARYRKLYPAVKDQFGV